jgi:hypothetical protein
VSRHEGLIFGIGPAKTASQSLAVALEMLGFHAYHYATQGKTLMQRAGKRGLPMLHYFREYQAFLDSPFSKLDIWPLLNKHHPNSKFIYTTRNEKARLKSKVEHVRWCRENIPGCKDPDPDSTYVRRKWSDYARRCMSRAKQLARQKPGAVLFMDICDKHEGWEVLCPFLGVEIPDVPFPKINVKGVYTHDGIFRESTEEILKRYENE